MVGARRRRGEGGVEGVVHDGLPQRISRHAVDSLSGCKLSQQKVYVLFSSSVVVVGIRMV